MLSKSQIVMVANLFNCVVTFSLPQKHVSQCKFATVQCPQCLESVRKTHLDEHKSEQCLQRLMTCPGLCRELCVC